MLARLTKRVKRIIGDKRIELFEFIGNDTLISSPSGNFHVEAATGQHHAKTLDELEDFLFAVIRKDTNAMNVNYGGFKRYYFGLQGFNVEKGSVTYGRASVLF